MSLPDLNTPHTARRRRTSESSTSLAKSSSPGRIRHSNLRNNIQEWLRNHPTKYPMGPNLFSHDHRSRNVEVTITIHRPRTVGTRGQDLRPVPQTSLCIRNNVGGRLVETRLWAGRAGYQIPAEARNFSLLQNVQNPSEAHPHSHSMTTGVDSRA